MHHQLSGRNGRYAWGAFISLAITSCFAPNPAVAQESSLSDQPGLISSQFIYEEAPFPQCHASTIAETPQGLVAAWFGGTHEKHSDVGIWVSRHVDGQWTAPVEVANGVQHADNRHPCWNPVLYYMPDDRLHLFYKVGPSPSDWWGMLTTSRDGERWSWPRRLPEDILGPVKNKPVLLEDGTLVCPSSTEHDGWRVHFELTDDVRGTWKRIGPVNDGAEFGAIQPTILQHGGGKLQALCRSQQGRITQTWSEDGGQTWGPMTATDLPNPNAGIDAVTLADRRHLLVYNHTLRGRSPLNVAISTDGRQWQSALVLENEPGEYSYPAVIQADDGRVHVTYTWKRRRIKHAVIDPERLEPRELSGDRQQ
ncbi:MAG: sialidase family protein [Pirellulales bacterium]